jgi:hypothetical protein
MAARLTQSFAVALVGGLLIAGAVAAQPPGRAGGPARGPAGPASGPALADLMKANDITETTVDPGGRWTASGRGANDIRLWAVLALKNPQGEARVALRYEYLSPAPGVAGGPPALSRMERIAVDCNGQRVRPLSAQTYPQHNFTGPKSEIGNTNTDWQPATSRPFLVEAIRLACSQTSTETAASSAAPFDIKDERATRRWMTDNGINTTAVQDRQWNMIGVTPQGIFFAPQGLQRFVTKGANTPLLVVRMERFVPAAKGNGQGTTLSETVFWEINCTSRQTHRAQYSQYEAHNLAGTAFSNSTRDGWIPVTQDPIVNSMWQEICAQTTNRTTEYKEAPPPPQSFGVPVR